MTASLYGLLAEFETAEQLIVAARRVAEAGLRRVEGYAPFPIHNLNSVLRHKPTRLPLIVLLGGILGALGGYFLQYWISVVDYPLNVGGRPYHSWPAFVPVTFECTILAAGLCAIGGFFFLNRLPRLHHPLFSVPGFEGATQDRLFLCVEADDPLFDRERLALLFKESGAVDVIEVENV